MQFLNPMLLWGLTAAAVPVIIHLLNRRRFRHQRWAAMEWLLKAAKQNQRRLQVENLLLLLLRVLAILLLALAIARPTLSDTPLAPVATTRTHLFVLLDNSASMGARAGTRTAFDEAVSKVNALIGQIGAEDPVTLVVTNDNTDEQNPSGRPRAFEANRNHAKLRSLIGELRPAAARADLLDALKILEDAVPEKGGVAARVAIVSDLQAVTMTGPATGEDSDGKDGENDPRTFLERLRDKGADVTLVPVGRPVDNVAIVSLGPADDRDIIQGNLTRFVAEIVNYSGQEQRAEVQFLVDGEPRGDSSVWVNLPPRPAGNQAPPAISAEFTARFDQADPAFHTIEARLHADSLPVDDTRSFAFRVRPPLQVLVVDGDPRPSEEGRRRESHYFSPILAIEEGGPFSVHTIDQPEFQSMHDLSGYDCIAMLNVDRPAPEDEDRRRLTRFVDRGGSLFLSVGNRVVADVWNDELYDGGNGLLPARLGETVLNADHPVQIDLRVQADRPLHPLLAEICDPQMAQFFKSPQQTGFIRVVNPAAESASRIVLEYTDLARSPALMLKRRGKGQVMLLTTTVDQDWGKLPGEPVFLALTHEAVYFMTAKGQAARNLTAFQPYRQEFPENFAGPFEVTLPDGSLVQAEADMRPDEPASIRFGRTDQVGLYSTVTRFKPEKLLSQPPPPLTEGFAVNVNPLESDLRRMEPDEARNRWRGLVEVSESFDDGDDALATRGGEISAQLLMAALLCLLSEVVLARRIGARRTQAA